MKQIAQRLEAQMAKAISLILAASHAAASEALDEAFGVARQVGERNKGPGAAHRPRRAPRSPMSPRRSGAQLVALEKQILDAVWATPGEKMSVLAADIGASPRVLQVPVARLKAAGRLKTVGSRQFTRYFPTTRESVDNDDGRNEAAA